MTLQKFDFNTGTQGANYVTTGNLAAQGLASAMTYDSAYTRQP